MEFKKLMSAAVILGAMSFSATTASANTGAASAASTHYGVAVGCTACHSDGNGQTNALTAEWLAAGGGKNSAPTNWAQFDNGDADSDGQTNAAELTAGTQAYPAPAAGSGGGGCVTSSITTPLTMALAMLTLGFFVRRKKD